MKDLTVAIDRVEGSSREQVKAEIERVFEHLKPLRDEGLRVRIAVAHSTWVAA